jgi:predicted AAA+ superfamily ATPase
MLRDRILLPAVRRALSEFPVTTVVGLRQVGKTTLSREAGPGRAFVTLDDLTALGAARRDPQGFLDALPRPVTIDEIQRVPELLLAIKREVDGKRRAGDFLLTGSARIEMRRGVKETLAGRAALLRLRPMTWAEADGRPQWNAIDKLLGCRSASDAIRRFGTAPPFHSERVLAGGLPVPILSRRGGASRGRWFDQYRSSYVERDVPPLLRVEEVSAFLRYLTLVAARTSQTSSFASLSRDAGVSPDTGLRWFGVLEATFLVDPLQPYWRNIGKRLVKSPKIHLGDTGLAARMLDVRDWKDAVRQNLAGALLETLVAQHALAFSDSGKRPSKVFHFRSHSGMEVDLVVERGNRLLPIEVKSASTVQPADLRGVLSFLKDFSTAPFGVVLYGGAESLPVARGVVALPLTRFLAG